MENVSVPFCRDGCFRKDSKENFLFLTDFAMLLSS